MMPLTLVHPRPHSGPVNLNSISLAHAAHLHGCGVADLMIGCPSYTWPNKTVIGNDDKPDGAVRTASYPANTSQQRVDG
jgi:hypothetical protein